MQISGGHQFKSDPRRIRGRNVAWQHPCSGTIIAPDPSRKGTALRGTHLQMNDMLIVAEQQVIAGSNPVDPTVLTITQKLRGKLLKHLYYLGPVTQFGRVPLLQSGSRGFKSRLCP